MGRRRVWPPKVHTHKNREIVYWHGHWYDLGKEKSEEARREYGRLLALWSVDPHAVPRREDDYLVSELLRDWLASSDSPTGKMGWLAKRAADLLCQHHADSAVGEFGPVALRSWQAWLCQLRDDNKRQTFNRTTIAHLLRQVRSAWKWAAMTERIPYERYEMLRTVPAPKYQTCREPEAVQAVSPDVVDATLPRLRPTVRAMVEFQRLTGARPEEVCQLRPVDVLRAGKVDVPGAGIVDLDREKIWVYLPTKHKGSSRRKPRWLVIGPRGQEILAPFLDRSPEAYCFSPAESLADKRREQQEARLASGGGSGGSRKKPTNGVKRIAGSRYSPNTYRQAIIRAAAKAGQPEWYPYQIRHAFAEDVDFALGLDAAQAAMGHAGPDVTRRYAKRSFRAAVDVAKKTG
jgi:integrase